MLHEHASPCLTQVSATGNNEMKPTLMSGSLNWRRSSMIREIPMASCSDQAHMVCLPMNHTTTAIVAGTQAARVT